MVRRGSVFVVTCGIRCRDGRRCTIADCPDPVGRCLVGDGNRNRCVSDPTIRDRKNGLPSVAAFLVEERPALLDGECSGEVFGCGRNEVFLIE